MSRLIADLGALVVHPGGSIEGVRILQVAQLEVGAESTDRKTSARFQRRRHPGEHIGVRRTVLLPSEKSKPALTQRNHRVVGIRSGEVAGVDPGKDCRKRLLCRRRRGEIDERLGDINPLDPDPGASKCQRMTARAAPHVEKSIARLEPEGVEEERDFLVGPLRERVPQIRCSHDVGHSFEPMADGRHFGRCRFRR